MCSTINELKEMLEHIDAATRSEIIKRCANYEREIKHLKEQYRQLNEVRPAKQNSTVNSILSRARSDIKDAIKRKGRCTVFYSDTLKRFKVTTQDARIATESKNSELVGVYTKGLDIQSLTEDLCEALEGS